MRKEVLEALDAAVPAAAEDEGERIATSGSALLAMTRDGGAVPRPSHCEPVTDVTGVGPALQGTIRDIRTPGRDEGERIVPARADPTASERTGLAVTEDAEGRIATSGSALLAMTRDGGVVPRPSHCEPVTDVTGVGPALQGTIRDIRTPSQDGGERIVPARADPTASERTGLAVTEDAEGRIAASGSALLAMTAGDAEAAESPDPEAQSPDLKTQNANAAALRQRAAAHLDSLRRQAEELRAEFPDFDLDAALRDPDFLRLTAPGLGVDLRRAYYALHREDLDTRAARRAAEETRRQLTQTLASGGLRPREGGGQEAAAALAADYRSLSRPQQLALKQRILEAAARGEKIYP